MPYDASLSGVFERQHDLQVLSFGLDPSTMTDSQTAEFVRWNILAAEDELHEAMKECRWKPWAKGDGITDRLAFGQELVDALHFLVNLFLVAGWTAEGVLEAYFAKAEVNANRQAAGYTGDDKVDGRATDEPVISFQPTVPRAWCQCGHRFGPVSISTKKCMTCGTPVPEGVRL